MGGGDSWKLLAKALVLTAGEQVQHSWAKPVSAERGTGDLWEGPAPRAGSSSFSSGLSWAVPSGNVLGVLRVPRAHPSPTPSLRFPVWMQSHSDPTFLAMVLPLITPAPVQGGQPPGARCAQVGL